MSGKLLKLRCRFFLAVSIRRVLSSDGRAVLVTFPAVFPPQCVTLLYRRFLFSSSFVCRFLCVKYLFHAI